MKSRAGQLAISGGVLVAVAMMAIFAAGTSSAGDNKCLGKHQTVAGNIGTNGRDVIIGTTGPDEIDGRGGADLICAKNGDDTVLGEAGDDYVDGEGGDDKVRGSLGDDGGRGGDVNCRGEVCLSRGAQSSGLFGGPGDDYLQGGAGNDFLDGQADDDEHRGGPGFDFCDDDEGTNTFRSCFQPI